jgi:hypothetical protein
VSRFLDTGFLLALLTHRSGAEKGWALLKNHDTPAGISSLQLFFVRHGLSKSVIDPKETEEVRDISVRAIKLLNWLTEQEVIRMVEIDYAEVIATAESCAIKLRTPMPSLLLIWPACAVVSGMETFLSFDPRTRALAKGAGLKVLPERL